jgi:hypothetical protein
MKIIISILMFASLTFAEKECKTVKVETATEVKEITTEVPKFMEGATIVVKLANGKEHLFPVEKYKVVPRARQEVVQRVAEKLMCTPDREKNRLSMGVGHGSQEGLDSTTQGNKVTVESNVGPVMAIQYQRLISDSVSLGVQLQSSETALGFLGIEF